MQGIFKFKMILDAVMLMAMLLSMAYLLIGESAHQWVGTLLGILFIVHNILNWRWYKNAFRGRYTIARLIYTAVNAMTLLAMAAVLISGLIFASYTPDSWRTAQTIAAARKLHLLGAYWSFVGISLHLGLHWQMICTLLKRKLLVYAPRLIWSLLRIIIVPIVIYGIAAMLKHDIFLYLFWQTEFVFFDSQQSLAGFCADYLAMLGLWVWFMHYLYRAALRAERFKLNSEKLEQGNYEAKN